ncbi:unnamed protein product [Candidula unifasciata]|uniref:Insulin-like domain-containing protein n=1 Tax=Candidula unifasciata TaxID=100452 RepID=A0A8S3ZB71_9EUPU|nr:unnamed protein product [Candidula unifasciata]
MNFSYKNYFTLALVLLTLCASTCQGNRRRCNIHSQPHPQGICGERLARAHENLCFLMRQWYPDHFSRKRSADDTFKEQLLNVPLSTFAKLQLSLNSRDVLFGIFTLFFFYLNINKHIFSLMPTIKLPNYTFFFFFAETPYHFSNTVALLSDGGYRQNLDRRHQPLESDGTRMTKTVLQLLTGTAYGRVKRVRRSMVCDCCINRCTTRHLATYC